MGKVELYHPVTEEKVREYVDATYPTDSELDSDAQEKDKQERVQTLLQAANENYAWRQSRSADEQIRLMAEPFASSPDNTDPDFTGEAEGDKHEDA